MKTIKNEQIQAILAELFRLNVPVASYDSIQKLLAGLPDAQVADGKAEKTK